MAYQSDPAGLGVGKHYGSRQAGDTAGVFGGVNAVETATFQVVAGDIAYLEDQAVKVPPYALVQEVFVRVDEAFEASSTVAVKLGAAALLTASADITAAGAGDQTLTGTSADLQNGADYADLTVDVNANGAASDTGNATVVVRYLRV